MANRRPLVFAVAGLPAVGVVAAFAVSALAAGTTADSTTPRTPYAVQCFAPAVNAVVPPGAIQTKNFDNVGTAGVSSSLAAIPTRGVIKVSLVRVVVTVSFSHGGAGGVATLRLPGHEYKTALAFSNPPLTRTLLVGPNSPTAFQVFTNGKATARVNAVSFIAAGTLPQQHLVAGTVCASGETANALVVGSTPSATATPTATPSASASASASSSSTSPSPSASPTSGGGLPVPIPLPGFANR